MKLVGSTWSCPCGANVSVSDIKTVLSKQVKRTLETTRMEPALSDEVGAALHNSYCDILEEMYSVTCHPWAGLVMPERMLWKAIRTMRGNKSVT